MAEEPLSDAQLQQLLKDAAQRLQDAKEKGKGQPPNDAVMALQPLPKITPDNPLVPYVTETAQGAQLDTSKLVRPEERKLANGIRTVEDPVMIKEKAAKMKKATAGADWYGLPRTNLTPELKRDLQLLKMRAVLDPKRHYKKEGSRQAIPEFSQVGTVIEGPTEFFSARLSNKDRKRTLLEEVLEGERATQRFKAKYNEIQADKTSGKKAHYKKLRALRRGTKG